MQSVLESRKSLTYDEYPLSIHEPAFSYVAGCFGPSSTPHLDARRMTGIEKIHQRMQEVKLTNPDFVHLTFYHQGSSPYSYEVDQLVTIWHMAGWIAVQGNDVRLTPLGEEKLQEAQKISKNQ